MIEGQMDPAVVGKFKMTPLESSMASDLKKAAEINDDVSGMVRIGSVPVVSFVSPCLVFLLISSDDLSCVSLHSSSMRKGRGAPCTLWSG